MLVLNFGYSDGDKELLRQTDLILRMMRTVARACGLPVPRTAPEDRSGERGARPRRDGGPVGA